MSRVRAEWVPLCALLASCTVGPDYRPPAEMAANLPTRALLEARAPAFSTEAPPDDWWRLYNAPALDALVRKALIRNTDLRTALASLEAAQAVLRSTELQRTPHTGLVGGATYGQASADEKGAPSALSPGPVYALGETVSYDFDLFGRIRRAIQADAADVDAARAALDLARVNVAASVTAAYASVCAAGSQMAVTNRSIALATNIVRVTDRRFRGGVAGVNDVVRARALLAQTRSILPNLEARQHAGLYLLATLSGDPPKAIPQAAALCITPPVVRRPIPVGDGASLLKRRPDVRQAERLLAGSVAQIGVATGALYPSIVLGGQVGTLATRAGDVARDRGFKWSIGPLLSWNFPNLAIARTAIAQTNALARGRLAAFDGTVLKALREVETSMSALARQLDTEGDLREARDQAAIAARNTEHLYAGGVGQFIDTLDAERTLIQADAALADATATVTDRQIELFMALGGGWQESPPPLSKALTDIIQPRGK